MLVPTSYRTSSILFYIKPDFYTPLIITYCFTINMTDGLYKL